MRTQIPKKFVFFGLPGSGKSTFAAKLSKVLDIPELHAKLAFQAKTMGMSLNTYVTEKLRFSIDSSY